MFAFLCFSGNSIRFRGHMMNLQVEPNLVECSNEQEDSSSVESSLITINETTETGIIGSETQASEEISSIFTDEFESEIISELIASNETEPAKMSTDEETMSIVESTEMLESSAIDSLDESDYSESLSEFSSESISQSEFFENSSSIETLPSESLENASIYETSSEELSSEEITLTDESSIENISSEITTNTPEAEETEPVPSVTEIEEVTSEIVQPTSEAPLPPLTVEPVPETPESDTDIDGSTEVEAKQNALFTTMQLVLLSSVVVASIAAILVGGFIAYRCKREAGHQLLTDVNQVMMPSAETDFVGTAEVL